MNTRNMRVVIVAALVAALLGGGVATARTLISGKDVRNSSLTGADVKNSSLTGKDIKNRSLGIGELSTATQRLIRAKSAGTKGDTGAVGPQGPAGAAGARGAAGAVGATGATGVKGETGATGPRGATGTDGVKGDTGAQGASFDPKKVTTQTAQLFGFTPWYDSDNDASTVGFVDGAIELKATTGRVGVNLPISRGASLSTLKSITYTQTGSAVLALEIYYRGGIGEYGNGTGNTGKYRGDYTTVRFEPTADGAQPNFLADDTRVVSSGSIGAAGDAGSIAADQVTTWGAVRNAIELNGRNAGAATPALKKQNLDAAVILAASVRTPGSFDKPTPTAATLTNVKILLRNAAAGVEYTFGTE